MQRWNNDGNDDSDYDNDEAHPDWVGDDLVTLFCE